MIYLILLLFLAGAYLCASGYVTLYRDRLGRTSIFVTKALISLFTCCGALTLGTFALLNFVEIGLDGMCSAQIAAQISSPNGDNVATIFTVDCGAVTSFDEIVPQVMLRDRFHPVVLDQEKEEIIFRKDWLGRKIDDIVYAGEMNSIRWLSNNHLTIQPVEGAPGDTTWQNVTISYKRPKQKVKVQ